MKRICAIVCFMLVWGGMSGPKAEEAIKPPPLTPDNVLGGMPGVKATEIDKPAKAKPGSSAAKSGPVKSFSHFQGLKPGSIQPQGWARAYTQAVADGWLLLYAKEKPKLVFAQYWKRINDMGENTYASYFAEGISHMTTMLPDSKVAKEFGPWLEKVLASQDQDGYLGEIDPPARWHTILDVNSQAFLLDALLSRYRATGDPRLLSACERSAHRIIKAWSQDDKEVTKGMFTRLRPNAYPPPADPLSAHRQAGIPGSGPADAR